MSDVTMIGLGPLGAAMARMLADAGYDTTVWNRTASRAEPLVAAGATLVSSPETAVAASPVVIVCVTNYAASDAILRMPEVKAALEGRVLVQLSTGSPAEARDAEAWVSACGAMFLVGHVQAYPREMGQPETSILLSGNEQGFDRCQDTMRILAPALSYLGPDAGAAVVMSLAITLVQFAARCGVMQGLAIAEATGLSRRQMAELAAPHLKRGIDSSFRDAAALDDPAYEETQAPLRIWKAGFPSVTETVRDAGCETTLVDALETLLDHAIDLGWRDVGAAALSKSMQGRRGPAG